MSDYPDVIRGWSYASSLDKGLKLLADVYPCYRPAPICLANHGWHGDRFANDQIAQLLRRHFVVVAPDMRGRGGSSGIPDANGFELMDAIDALEAARVAFPEWVSDDPPRVWGASGGGGNTYALVAKCPDLFARAAVGCGISDYAEWFRGDRAGQYTDEMIPWIGCTPDESETAYQARSGLHLLPNVLSPIAIWHGDMDPYVPVWHARSYAQRASELGIPCDYYELPGVGHGLNDPCPSQMMDYLRQPALAPVLPREGELIIGSFLYTKAFRIILNAPGQMAMARYRLDKEGQCDELTLSAENAVMAQVFVPPSARVDASFPFERCFAT